jgi:hypothetical protein
MNLPAKALLVSALMLVWSNQNTIAADQTVDHLKVKLEIPSPLHRISCYAYNDSDKYMDAVIGISGTNDAPRSRKVAAHLPAKQWIWIEDWWWSVKMSPSPACWPVSAKYSP